MAIYHQIDCRDESIKGTNCWYSSEEGTCGLAIDMNGLKIYLTSSQIEVIIEEWRKNESAVKTKLCEQLLGYKESSDATS